MERSRDLSQLPAETLDRNARPRISALRRLPVSETLHGAGPLLSGIVAKDEFRIDLEIAAFDQLSSAKCSRPLRVLPRDLLENPIVSSLAHYHRHGLFYPDSDYHVWLIINALRDE